MEKRRGIRRGGARNKTRSNRCVATLAAPAGSENDC